MTSNIVNLNKARKAKARSARKSQADENAVKFGRSKAEKTRDAITSRLQRDFVDGHKNDR